MKFLVLFVTILISVENFYCHHHGRNFKSRLNFFDVELLRATAEEKEGNVLVSPASVKSTLAMLLAGAEGTTARELENALRVIPIKDNLRDDFHLYLSALRSNASTAILKNANGVFVSKKLKLNPKYESIVKHDYFSEVTEIDYSDSGAAAANINKWVNDNTHGLVPFVVEPAQVSQSTDIVVANALFFKSSWLHAFNPHDTRSSCFYRNEDCKTVAMMELQTELNYAHVEDLRAHAVEIPYEGKRYSMIILVPLFKDGIEALIRDMPYISLSQIAEMMHPEEVLLSLPKFAINYNENLVESLRKMHITSLFTNKSNLSKIFDGDVPYVDSFHHKVFMSVDETGTIAAAASAAMIIPLINTGRVEVTADRPFLFFVRDNDLGVVLFEGKIEEPSILEHDLQSHVKNHAPTSPPAINRKAVHPVQSPKPKSNGFLETFKSIYG